MKKTLALLLFLLPFAAGAASQITNLNPEPDTSSGSTQNVNITQVGGNAVTTSVPVSITAPTDSYPTGGTITTQDVASTTVQGQFNQNQTTGTPTAGSTVSFSVAGFTTFTLGITNTWTGTVTLEGANAPGGVTTSTVWTEKTCRVPGTSRSTSNFTLNASDLLCNVSGYTNARIRATAAITGTVTIGAAGESVNLHAFDLINPVKIVDGSGTSSTLTIKAASTAPLVTDTAAVVTISPNSPSISTIPTASAIAPFLLTTTTGGTFQQIAAANTARRVIQAQNRCAESAACSARTTDYCYLFFGTTAAANTAGIYGNGIVAMAPGQGFYTSGGAVSSDAIQSTCATANDIVTGYTQ